MNLFEQIAIAGIAIVIGAGVIMVSADASSMASAQTQLVTEAADPAQLEDAVIKAQVMSRAIYEQNRAATEQKPGGTE